MTYRDLIKFDKFHGDFITPSKFQVLLWFFPRHSNYGLCLTKHYEEEEVYLLGFLVAQGRWNRHSRKTDVIWPRRRRWNRDAFQDFCWVVGEEDRRCRGGSEIMGKMIKRGFLLCSAEVGLVRCRFAGTVHHERTKLARGVFRRSFRGERFQATTNRLESCRDSRQGLKMIVSRCSYYFHNRPSGARYSGVPQKVLVIWSSRLSSLQSPKSVILMWPSASSNKFSSLRSR